MAALAIIGLFIVATIVFFTLALNRLWSARQELLADTRRLKEIAAKVKAISVTTSNITNSPTITGATVLTTSAPNNYMVTTGGNYIVSAAPVNNQANATNSTPATTNVT